MVREKRIDFEDVNYRKKGQILSGIKTRLKALKKYYKNPNNCNTCGKIIEVLESQRPSDARKKKFCDHKCFGNRQKKEGKCSYCQKPCKASKDYCSRDCYINDFHSSNIEKLKSDKKIDLHYSSIRKSLLWYYDHKCQKCGNDKWNGEKIPLEIDHINGNPDDNNFDNLRLICPNCHAQTDTYKGKNKGQGRQYRRKKKTGRNSRVEYHFYKVGVEGSSPSVPTIYSRGLKMPKVTTKWFISEEDIDNISDDDIIPLVGTYGDLKEFYRSQIDKMILEELMGQ